MIEFLMFVILKHINWIFTQKNKYEYLPEPTRWKSSSKPFVVHIQLKATSHVVNIQKISNNTSVVRIQYNYYI